MSTYQIIYDLNRFPKRIKREDGTYGCRGCGGDIPPKRQTWCSGECSRKYNPMFVISEVRKRDKDVCCFCDFDLKKAEADWWKSKPDYLKSGWNLFQRWQDSKPKMNYDHITPFSEGGMTVLENMRTLCEPCHKKRTKDWHKERRLSRSQQSTTAQLLLLT